MVFNRDFDRRYQVTRMNGGSSDRRYTRDKNGRVAGITNVRTPGLAGLNAALGYAGKSNRLEKISSAGAGKYAYEATPRYRRRDLGRSHLPATCAGASG